MKTEITNKAIYLAEIKGKGFAFKYDRECNKIQMGISDKNNLWQGFLKRANEIYLGQCANGLKEGLGFLGTIASTNIYFNYIGEFEKDRYNGLGILKEEGGEFIGNFKYGLKEGLVLSQSEFNSIGVFKNDKKNGIFIIFQMIHSEIVGKKVCFLKSIDFYEENVLIESVFLELDLAFENIYNNIEETVKTECRANSFINKFFVGSELCDNILKLTFIDFQKSYFINFEFNCFHYSIEATYFLSSGYQKIRRNDEFFSAENQINNLTTKLVEENFDGILLINDHLNVYFDNYFDYPLTLTSFIGEFKANTTCHSFKLNGTNDEFKIINDEDETFFSESTGGLNEVISLNKLLAVDHFINNNEIMPWTKNEWNYNGFQKVPYRNILTYSALGIDSTIPYYTFIDTETNGLPVKGIDNERVEKWPRIIQIAILQYSVNGFLLRKWQNVICPKDFEILPDHISGISQEMALKNGNDLESVLYDLEFFIKMGTSVIVCHNTDFDLNVINAEFKRIDSEFNIFEFASFCTMKGSMNFLKIKTYPKLDELFKALFGYKFSNAHDAVYDIEATAKCFWRLKQLDAITV